jgi:hypothetical protein
MSFIKQNVTAQQGEGMVIVETIAILIEAAIS